MEKLRVTRRENIRLNCRKKGRGACIETRASCRVYKYQMT
jgi:hypothetical protein